MYIILPILLLLCWLAVYLSEKRNIFNQWLFPVRRRLSEFFLGLILSIALCLLTQIFLSQLGDRTWHLSKDISIGKVTFSLLYDLNSVVSEELLFRGLILYFLIKYWKTGPAMLISASVFGIYHWFTFRSLGKPDGHDHGICRHGFDGICFCCRLCKDEINYSAGGDTPRMELDK